MKHRPFVLGTTLVFAMVACSGSDDDATTSTQGQVREVAPAMASIFRRAREYPVNDRASGTYRVVSGGRLSDANAPRPS